MPDAAEEIATRFGRRRDDWYRGTERIQVRIAVAKLAQAPAREIKALEQDLTELQRNFALKFGEPLVLD